MKEKLKISNFKTPQDYFENFDDTLFGRLQEESFPKETGFKVPEKYFEQFEKSIVGAETDSIIQPKVIPIFSRKYLSYAAAIAALFIIGLSIFNINETNDVLDQNLIGSIDQYIEEGNLNMDLYDLTSYLETQELSAIDFDYHFIPQGEMKDYLLENTDENLLIDQLY